MKQKTKGNILKYFIVIIVLFLLIKSTDFFRKVYLLSQYNYDQRIAKNYGRCNKGSVGFVHFLKKKYKLTKQIKILDYDINPSPDWVLFSIKKENIYKDKLILLNYRKEEENLQFTKLKDNLFFTSKIPPHFFTIKKANFLTSNNISNIKLEISNRHKEWKQILLSKDFQYNNATDEIELNLDLEKYNIRLGQLFIQILDNENNLKNINEINLKIIPHYNLQDYKVLEKIDNCYFLERLS